MNTEDGKLISQEKSDIIVVICRFLDELQDKYSLNDFCPAKVKDTNDGEIILNRWQLDEFKNSKIY